MNFFTNQTVRHGASMVEVVIATLLTGVVIIGSLEVMGSATRTRTASSQYVLGPMLANELLAEVMSKSYEDPEAPGTGSFFGVGKESGETTRSTFDDVDDYLNYSESPPLDSNDQPMAQYSGWTRGVTLIYVAADTGSNSIAYTGLTKIIVTVTTPGGIQTKRYGFRSKDGALEQPVAVDSEIVTWIGAELQIGTQGIARAGTNLTNAATD